MNLVSSRTFLGLNEPLYQEDAFSSAEGAERLALGTNYRDTEVFALTDMY